jgi:hypothetical protein
LSADGDELVTFGWRYCVIAGLGRVVPAMPLASWICAPRRPNALEFLRLIASPEEKPSDFLSKTHLASHDWPICSRRIKTAVAIFLPLNCSGHGITPI